MRNLMVADEVSVEVKLTTAGFSRCHVLATRQMDSHNCQQRIGCLSACWRRVTRGRSFRLILNLLRLAPRRAQYLHAWFESVSKSCSSLRLQGPRLRLHDTAGHITPPLLPLLPNRQHNTLGLLGRQRQILRSCFLGSGACSSPCMNALRELTSRYLPANFEFLTRLRARCQVHLSVLRPRGNFHFHLDLVQVVSP